MKYTMGYAGDCGLDKPFKVVELNTVEDLIALAREEEYPIIVDFYSGKEDRPQLLVYDSYIE